jgi:hypothetical protein
MTSVGTVSELHSQVVVGNRSLTCEVLGESIYIYMPVIEQQLLIRDVCALSERLPVMLHRYLLVSSRLWDISVSIRVVLLMNGML